MRGIERLRLLERVAPATRRLAIGFDPITGATSWRVETATAALTLLLSPESNRGLSGEGQVLADLAEPAWAAHLPRVRAALRWRSVVEATAFGEETGLTPDAARGALAALGSRGLVGFDAAAGAFFHRELPFDLDRVADLHPRLLDARRLVADGGVRLESPAVAWVRGTDTEHHVRLSPTGDRCTCTWWAKHQGERGPCKHVLAARLASGDEEAG